MSDEHIVATLELHAGADAVGTLRCLTPGMLVGGRYDWCCTAALYGDEARLYGALRAPTASQWRAMAVTLREAGVRRVIWERRNVPNARQVVVYI